MQTDMPRGDRPPDDESDLADVLDYPRLALVHSAPPGGLARLMRAMEAVQED